MNGDIDKMKLHAKERNTQRFRPSVSLDFLVKVIRTSSGRSLSVIAHRVGLSRQDLRVNMQPLIADGRASIDSQSRVHHREPERRATAANQTPNKSRKLVARIKNKRSATRRTSSSDRQGDSNRADLVGRIRKNRRTWIQNVKNEWTALASDPEEWRANLGTHLNHIKTNIVPSASHYLAASQVDGKVKAQAKDVLGVYRAIIAVETLDHDLDPKAFIPFKWPSTEIRMLADALSPEAIAPSGAIFTTAGYRVGRNGLSEAERQSCLRWLYVTVSVPALKKLPAGECGRLRRIACLIAFHVRNAKHQKKADKSKAISDWEADLAWMKRTFYDGSKCERHGLKWPVT